MALDPSARLKLAVLLRPTTVKWMRVHLPTLWTLWMLSHTQWTSVEDIQHLQVGVSPYPTAALSHGLRLVGGYHIHTFHSNNRSICGDDQYLPQDTPGQHSEHLGWMFDGFPIYGELGWVTWPMVCLDCLCIGPYSQGGELPSVLDECNGHTHMVDGVLTYHYHFTGSYPWTIGKFSCCLSRLTLIELRVVVFVCRMFQGVPRHEHGAEYPKHQPIWLS